MTQRPSGWYDDPDEPDQLRYWDGILWSNRTMPKVKPGLEDSHLGAPARHEEQTERIDLRKPADPYAGPRRPQPQQGPGRMSYGPLPVPQTPDGAQLSGWWRRVGAYIIDYLLVIVVAAIITYPWLSDWMTAYQDWVDDMVTATQQQTQAPAMPSSVLAFPWQTMVVNLVLYAIYEITMIARWGQTIGKMATGIRVRQAGTDQLLSLHDSAIRFVIKQVNIIGALIPVIGSLAVIFTVVNYLSPLFDRMKQAIHDRGAHSYVVRKR